MYYDIWIFAYFELPETLLDLPPDSRLKILNSKMVFDNVTTADIQVVQCNASNLHGYVFANAFLNVIGKLPWEQMISVALYIFGTYLVTCSLKCRDWENEIMKTLYFNIN